MDKAVLIEMQKLIKTLNEASDAYYNDDPILPDVVYDALFDRLAMLEQKHGYAINNSPTQSVGYEVRSQLAKVRHEYPSLSLDKTKDREVMRDWLGERLGVLSWKCDGLTVILTYDHGRLVGAATRGDGAIGEDVTRNAVNFLGVPLDIDDKRHIVIRGEAVIPYQTFDSINEKLPSDKQYKNPRNMAVGAVKMLDPRKSANFRVMFIPFELVNAGDLGFDSFMESLDYLEELGFRPVDRIACNSSIIVDQIATCEDTVEDMAYPTDGLVVVYDDLKCHEAIGVTRRFPKYAKAFKWADTTKTTIVRGIKWSVSEVGLISPVAIFDPVELEGSTVRQANLHNISEMRNLGIGIGDHIRVYKANKIIPQVLDCIEKTGGIDIPTKCPRCGAPTEQRLGVNKRSLFLNCTNANCNLE